MRCVCMCVCARASVFVHACMPACACMRACVHACVPRVCMRAANGCLDGLHRLSSILLTALPPPPPPSPFQAPLLPHTSAAYSYLPVAHQQHLQDLPYGSHAHPPVAPPAPPVAPALAAYGWDTLAGAGGFAMGPAPLASGATRAGDGAPGSGFYGGSFCFPLLLQ